MIGKGAKYLKAAGFGRYRITAASLGRNLMFGSLWLTAATKQAIMDAFGVDGTAVIAATNEYLNGIAASDKAKATALAGFINEDPMMVCSLGLEPTLTMLSGMPRRKITSSGSGYLRTSIKEEDLYGLKFGLRVNGNKAAWASYLGGTLDVFTIGSANTSQTNAYIRYRAVEITRTMPTSTSKLMEYELLNGNVKVDGTQVVTYSGTPFSTYTGKYITLGNNGDGNRPNYCSFSHVELYDSQNKEHQYLPFVREGVVDMLNIETGTMAEKSGTWTLGYELPDGTPWTPSTP